MHFEAWALPWGFQLGSDERYPHDDGTLPGLEYPRLSPERSLELLEVLRRGGEALSRSPTSRILMAVDLVARRLLDPGDDLQREALDLVGSHGGYSPPMVGEILHRMALQWTRPFLETLLHAEFPDPHVLDRFRLSPNGREVRATGFPLAFHLGSGTVPGVATTSMIRSLMVKSAVLLKPGRGDVPLPVLFARALQEAEPEVGGAVAVGYWPRAEGEETERFVKACDLVVVYGGDQTVAWVRNHAPVTTRVVSYRHRVGVGLVGRKALAIKGGEESALARAGLERTARETAVAAARAVAVFDQKGCVSPHVIFVEAGGETSPSDWTEMLASALAEMEASLPSGPLSPEEGAALQQFRGEAEMDESLGRGLVIHGRDQAPWTVRYRPEGELEVSCLNRSVTVIPLRDATEIVDVLKPWGPFLQTVGVTGVGGRLRELLERLVRLGVSRVVELGEVPWPSPWWHHDGVGPLQALVRWTDVEGL